MANEFDPQVIPEWVSALTKPKDPLRAALELQEDRHSTNEGLKGLLRAAVDRGERQRQAAQDPSARRDRRPRLANRAFVVALDNQLRQGCGLTLARFVPPRRLRALEPGQERYFASAKDPLTGEQRQRSCLRDSRTRASNFELPIVARQGVKLCYTLHVACDQGSIGNPAMLWFFHHLGGRGTMIWDRFHRVTNDWLCGVADAGLAMARFEWAVPLSLRSGPWQKAGNHRVLQQAAREMFDRCDANNPVFAWLYDGICADLHKSDDPNFGEVGHMREVWDTLAARLLQQPLGDAYRVGRWWKFEEKGEQFLSSGPGLHATLLLLVYVGWRRGWWSSFDESPLGVRGDLVAQGPPDDGQGLQVDAVPCSDDEGEGGNADSDGVGDDDHVPEAGAASDERLGMSRARISAQQARRKVANTMRYSATVMARPLGLRLFQGMVHASVPLRKAFAQELQAVKTRRGSMHLHQELLQGSFAKTLHATLSNVFSADFARDVGVGLGPKSERKAKEDSAVGMTILRLVCAVVGQSIVTNLSYTDMPPYIFVGLVHADEAVVQATLAQCKVVWETLCSLEAQAWDNSRCAAWVRSFLFSSSQWCREILIGLAEARFACVPGHLRPELLDYALAQKTTLMIENMGNLCRRVERKNGSGKLAPLTAWHRCSRSQLAEEYDRPSAPVTSAAKAAAATSVPQQAFEADPQECSLTDEQLDSLHMSSPDWPNLSPDSQKFAALRWKATLSVGGDWQRLQSGFLNMLVQVGGVVAGPKDRGLSGPFLVLLSRPACFVAWRLVLAKTAHDKVFLKLPGECTAKEQIQCLRVERHEDWRCLQPVCVGSGHPTHDPWCDSDGFALMAAGKAEPLLPFACRRGLKGMSVVHLRELFDAESIPFAKGSKPKTESDLVQAIVRHVLKGCTDDEVNLAVGRRDEDIDLPIDTVEPLLEKDGFDLVIDDIGNEELADEVLRYKEKLLKQRVAKEAKHAKMAKMGSASSSSGAVQHEPQRKAVAWAPGRGLLQTEAKKYCPPKFSLAKDMTWHFRWIIRSSAPKWSATRAFGKEASEACDNEALLFCLRKAWHKHEEFGGAPCPYALDGSLF